MKSIEKLRELSTFGTVKVDSDLTTTNMLMVCATKQEINEIAYEIEAEIEDASMLLPVDGDGEALRIGDDVWFHDDEPGALPHVVCGYGTMREGGADVFLNHRDEGWAPTSVTRPDVLVHRNSDPVKALLAEMASEVWEASCTCQTTWSDSGLDGIEERYAERFRELMEEGGDE